MNWKEHEREQSCSNLKHPSSFPNSKLSFRLQIHPNANDLLFIKSNSALYTTFKFQCCLLQTNWSKIKIIPAMWAPNRCDKCGARMQSDVTPENHASNPLTSHISTVLHSEFFCCRFWQCYKTISHDQMKQIQFSYMSFLFWSFLLLCLSFTLYFNPFSHGILFK
jgi:hypothetical protein